MAVRTVRGERLWSWQLGEGLLRRIQSLTYTQTGKRDLRLDFLRGLAVSFMVVDHVGGDTILTHLTGGNRFIVSAAEAFIFLSGLVVGMVYRERIRRSGAHEAACGMLQRAFTLYKAAVGIALVFLALFVATDVRLWVDRSSALSGSDVATTLFGIITLHQAFHGSDVLVMYTFMLVAAPAIIYLLHQGHTLSVLLGSFALWGLYQHFPSDATVPWTVVDSPFPVAAWQLLFVLGMITGFHKDRMVRWLTLGSASLRVTVALAASVVYLIVWSYERFESAPLPSAWFGDTTYGALFSKTSLGPGRVLTFLAAAVLVYTFVNALWVPLSDALGWFLLPLGQNSLYVYIVHIFLVVFIYNTAPLIADLADANLINLACQFLALGVAWAMVRSRFLFAIVPR